MNKAELAASELLIRISNLNDKYIVFMQEPYTYKHKIVGRPEGSSVYPTISRRVGA